MPHASLGLRFKSLVLGTPFETVARQLRWVRGIRQRIRHPELWGIYSEEIWLPRVLQQLLTRSSCVADVGCHIGSFLSLAVKYAPEGSHIAFEPSPIRSSLARNRFPQVEVLSVAVGEANGGASFVEDAQRPGFSHLVYNKKPDSNSFIVEVRRLDDVLLQRHRIDLIKIDIEGGELSAIRGASETIRKWHPLILFECGPEYTTGEAGLDKRALFDTLTEFGYSIYTYEDFLFGKGGMAFDEFCRCGLYPFRAFNFIARVPSKASSI